jgi:hypothetical protein
MSSLIFYVLLEVIFFCSEKCNFSFPIAVQKGKLLLKKGKKMSCDTFVLVGNIVATPSPPLKCHILFEWPK